MTASRVCDENGVRVTRQRKELVVEKECVQQYGAIALGKPRQGKLFISTLSATDIAESPIASCVAAGLKRKAPLTSSPSLLLIRLDQNTG